MYRCKRLNCDKVFTQRSNCSTHQKKCDKGPLPAKEEPNLVCHICSRVSSSAWNLKRHIESCSEKVKQKKEKKKCTVLPCTHESCDKTFLKESRLQRHLKSHEPKKLFICPGCSVTYVREDKFNLHTMKCFDFHLNDDAQSLSEIPTLAIRKDYIFMDGDGYIWSARIVSTWW